WSHGPTTEDVSGLAAGSYTVTVTDANTCMQDSTFNITEPGVIIINKVITHVSIPGGSDGAIDITPGGGTPGYSYSWSHGPTTQDVSGLPTGTYTVTVTDALACTLDSTFSVSEPTGMVINRNITNVRCYSQNNGSIDITVTGGTPGYTYSWNHGATTEDVSGLQSGNFTVTVTDDLGITVDSTFYVAEPPALVINKIIADAGCYNGGEGSIDISISGGTPGYTCSWNHGPIEEDVYGLTAGSYVVTVTDANGCSQDSTFIINEPPAIQINRVVTNVTCPGGNDGAIDISTSGGMPGYSYSWSHGLTSEDIFNLTATTYTVTVTDSKDCTLDSTFFIGEPTAILINRVIKNVTCNGGNDGAIDLTVTGGTAGYTFSWNHGPTSEDINDLIPGSYTVTVTDANGCSQDSTFVIDQPSASESPLSASTDRNNICPGDGSIVLSYTGGMPGGGAVAVWYSDNYFMNKVGQDNNVTIASPDTTTEYFVRFEGTCDTTSAVSVTVTVLTLSVSPDNAFIDRNTICPGDGNIILSYTGGLMGDEAEAVWYDDANLISVIGTGNNLSITAPSAETSYYVRFESACNITDATSTTLYVYPVPVVDLGTDTNLCGIQSVSLDAGDDGTVYLWSTGETTREISVSQGGQIVWVKVTNAYGCEQFDTIYIYSCSVEDIFQKIPNTFTPNGDNVNETWYFGETTAYPDMEVEIFDRWGRLIYRSERGYPEPWDGKAPNGRDLPVDSYYYVIKLNDGSEPMTGIVTIIR
ncbi:MAG: hypothetical protein AMS27_17585, partial [Bacteroides sp. SM23_62_1]